MKAIRYHKQGPPDVLVMDEIPVPALGPTDVLVAVGASGVNPHEVSRRAGLAGPPIEEPIIPGIEAAGTVEIVGERVTLFKPGDRVIVRQPTYSYSEYIAAPEAILYNVPEPMRLLEAATVAIAFTTAWHALVVRAQAQKGETVLVQAAASGVGIAAIQLAKLLGMTVIGTAGTDEKIEWAKKYGLDHGINYQSENFVHKVMDITGGVGADVVIDGVGGEILPLDLSVVTSTGRIAVFGAAGGRKSEIPVPLLYASGAKSILGANAAATPRKDFEQILQWIANGKLRTTIDKVWPLEEAASAHIYQSSRQIKGKTALIVRDD